MQQLDLQSLLAAVDVPADWVGIREVTETHTPRVVRDGVPEINGCFTTQGLMVEVLADGQFGYYGTPNMTDKGISVAAKKAYVQAKQAAKHATYKFTTAVRPANVGSYQSPFVKEKDTITPGELNKILLDAYNQLKVSDKIVSARALVQTIQTLFRFVSSNGSDITQDFLMLEFDLSATAADGANQQTRTFGGMRGTCRQMGMEFFDKWELLAQAQKIGEQAIEILDADECPTGVMDLVIASDQMMLQIHESVGHALEVDRILGDERNYA
ncbi:MAG TPA: TldD/PmbA family protein, partial [Candidatus Marinimicrobia bacterium]|nr:TldD/PmbA family protein [Candidatus Neomarinimicrobiota bacterium]